MTSTKQGTSTNGGNQPLIVLRNVVKTFTSKAGPVQALKNVQLTVNGGEFLAIIGKSGSGKSTLINMITCIDRPTSGEVLIGGTAVHSLRESATAQWRGQNIGIVFQFFQLLPALSLVENVMLPMDFCNKFTPRERKVRIRGDVGLIDGICAIHVNNDGKDNRFTVRYLAVYERSGDGWRMLAWQSTRMADA